MPDVLSMPARQNCAPVMLIVSIEIRDLLSHRSSRTYPLLVFVREVGRHHLMMDKVMRKQMPEETTSGTSTE